MTTPIPAPPVGARVRHTTTYSQGTTVTIEGHVVLGVSLNCMADPRIYIGDDADQLVAYLADRPGEYTVALEILETPHPAEPPNGTIWSNGANVWIRCDDPQGRDPEGRWWCAGGISYQRWADIAELVTGPGWRRYIPDPADTIEALPASITDTRNANRATIFKPTPAHTIYIDIPETDYTPDTVEQLAAAMLRAVREARQL